MKVYFDNSATTKLHPQVLQAMIPYLTDNFGNPSSIHSLGNKAKVAIENSREIIANFINADASEIYFTSGGSEANNFCIRGIAQTEFYETNRKNIVTTSIEHPSILKTFDYLKSQGFITDIVSVDEKFQLDEKKISELSGTSVSLLSVMYVNNETGSINDIEKINNLTDNNIFIHTDAVQAFGKIKIDVKKLGVDALSASAHKIYGPKGIGFAYVKNGTPLNSLIFGGGQERNRRAGTENVASIVGFAEAVKLAKEKMDDNFTKVEKLKNYFVKILNNKVKNISFNQPIIQSSEEFYRHLPYVLSITFSPKYYNVDTEAMLILLDINGIAASNGSACSSGTIKPSHVIMASGKSKEYANGTLRFSFSPENNFEEIDYTINVLKEIAEKFKR